MKRIITIILVLFLFYTTTACGKSTIDDQATAKTTPTTTVDIVSEATQEPEEFFYIKEDNDIHIIKSGAVLKDIIILGDLYIDETVGDGEYFLENIIINGTMYIYGSGQNSGHMISVQGTKLIISSETNPRLVCDFDTSFDGVQIASDCIVETEGSNIKNVVVNNTKTEKAINLIMKGKFPEVTLESTANITLDGGINLMSVLKNAGMTEINMIDDSKMYFFSTYGKSVTIHGGTIIEAWINAEYCSLPEAVNKIGSEVGIAEVNIGDTTYTIPKNYNNNDTNEESKEENTPISSILLDTYPKISSNGMVINISVAAYEKCNIYALVESKDVGLKGTTPEKVRDGISAGAGNKMPDGAEYIVIHKTAIIANILEEISINIDFNDYIPSDNQGNDDQENDSPGPPEDVDNSNYIFIVIEDSNGKLSEVYEYIT